MRAFTIRLVAILAVSLTCVAHDTSAGQADGKPRPDAPAKPQPNTQPGGSSAIEVLGTTLVLIDPASCRGESLMYIGNPSGSPVDIRLHGAPGDGASGAPSIAFAPTGSTGDGKTSFEASLPPRSVTPIRIVMKDVASDGDLSVDVFNMGTKFAKVAVRRSPVGLSLDTVVSAQNPLRAVRGEKIRLVLKNPDPISYSFRWALRVGGQDLCQADSAPATVRPFDLVALECTPAIKYSLDRMQDLFRPQTTEGALDLYAPDAPGADIPLKIIPLAAVSVSLFSTSIQLAVSYVVLLVILVMGGVTSLVLSQALPNQLKRLNVKERLEELMIATSNLTDHLDSKLLVLVRLERSRLFELLRSRTAFSPEFASIVTQCTEGADKLRARVELLKQMDVICGRLAKSLTSGVAPSLVRGVVDNLQTAGVMLAKSTLSDAEMHDATTAIERASTQVGSLDEPDAAFGQTLAKRVAEIKTEMTASLLNTPTWVRIVQVVPGPWNQLQSFSDATVPQGQLVSLDFAVEKLLLMRDYVLLKEGANDPDMSLRLQQREPELLRLLQLTSHQGLQVAQRLVREMSEDQAPAQLLQAIQADPDEATIEMAPTVAYDRAPLEFSICFYNRALNVAAAKEE